VKTLLQGAIVVAAFVLANVVAAGVMLVLAPHVLALEDGPVKLAAVLLLGALAVAVAVIFLKGCIREIADQLQYGQGRRGG